MKRILFALVIIATMLAIALPVAADGPDTPPGNSQPGITRYLDNPGRVQAGEVGAQGGSGAASGTFGYLGKDNNMGNLVSGHCDTCGSYPGPGTIGYITGLNNSGVAGNRQGNLP